MLVLKYFQFIQARGRIESRSPCAWPLVGPCDGPVSFELHVTSGPKRLVDGMDPPECSFPVAWQLAVGGMVAAPASLGPWIST